MKEINPSKIGEYAPVNTIKYLKIQQSQSENLKSRTGAKKSNIIKVIIGIPL